MVPSLTIASRFNRWNSGMIQLTWVSWGNICRGTSQFKETKQWMVKQLTSRSWMECPPSDLERKRMKDVTRARHNLEPWRRICFRGAMVVNSVLGRRAREDKRWERNTLTSLPPGSPTSGWCIPLPHTQLVSKGAWILHPNSHHLLPSPQGTQQGRKWIEMVVGGRIINPLTKYQFLSWWASKFPPDSPTTYLPYLLVSSAEGTACPFCYLRWPLENACIV